MLKIKIFKNDALQMPETVLEADNTMDLIDPYLQQSPVTGVYKGIFGRINRAARYTDIPRWGVIRNKAFQSSAYLCDAWVKKGLAEWLEFNEDEFDPKKAISRSRAAKQNQANAQAARKAYFANQSPEERLAQNQAKSLGWAKRKERLAQEAEQEKLAKLTERRIAQGREVAVQDLPEWFTK